MQSQKIFHKNNLDKLSEVKKTCFVSGTFDLIHPGHIHFLRKAKSIVGKEGKLIVALHDDKTVSKHKGIERPFFNLDERAIIISELESVDFVIKWEGWENVIDLVKKLKPDFLAVTKKSYEYSDKGEWKGESWEEVAKKIGAKVVEIELENPFSTSEILERLKGRIKMQLAPSPFRRGLG